TRGGRAAGIYLADQFQKLKLQPAGTRGTYFQPFNGNCRNILGLYRGSETGAAQRYILVGAHYDHVGYGTRENSNGPIGYIHNGADDNASGVAGVLEIAKAVTKLPQPLRHSILFVLWDNEENGLYGSKHWVRQPTVPLSQIDLAFNIDMIGRLRGNRIEVFGIRTSTGLRRLLTMQNRAADLKMDFDWDMDPDSDDYTLHKAGIPTLMLFTGKHADYHRPSDDLPLLNLEGIQRVARLYFNVLLAEDEREMPRKLRAASRQESNYTRHQIEVPLAAAPSRLGVKWSIEKSDQAGLRLSSVTYNSPAWKAGLRQGDRIVDFNGNEVNPDMDLVSLILATKNPAQIQYLRGEEKEPRTATVTLNGQPVHVGLSWRGDAAEPDAVMVTRVFPGSPAATGGLRVLDRVYEVNGEKVTGAHSFGKLLQSDAPLEMVVESGGRIREVTVKPLVPAAVKDPSPAESNNP
ncbi:MAG: M20/M25/M40 family metallo-hydrolase, partial [Planctomycetota bacterium]|nr:M20/M25/M40 family metallo-hydrolase [Planctomycetota bacterium]